MKINTVAVIGAGAVGAYFNTGLTERLGDRLMVIAEGARAERLKRDGLIVNDRQFHFNVCTPEEAGKVDLVIVSVKYGALKEILPMIETLTGEHTIVMSVLNGVDSEEVIAKRIGEEHMIYSVMKIASRRTEQIRYNPDITLGVFFGEKDGSISERILAIRDLFEGTPVHYQIRENIIQEIWYKYALNVSRNIPQAILCCGYGAYLTSEHVAAISDRMREEVVRVAAAKGIDISDPDNAAGKNVDLPPDARFSTLQDLDARRPTEVDMFCGTMVRLGRELGVPTPFNEFALHAVKALEEKNRGIFE